MNGRIQSIDPGNRTTWPDDIVSEVDRIEECCRDDPENAETTPSYDLSKYSLDYNFETETAFRALLGRRPVSFFHATRLLPHEFESVRTRGLMVLNEEDRSLRLDRVIEIYGGDLGVERLEGLRKGGPLHWDPAQRSGRLGTLHCVTPLSGVLGAGREWIRS